MRLIDADALKELFPDEGEGSWTYNVTAKSYIDAQPTIDPEPQWIPVTERLPDKKAEVIYSLEPDIDKLIITIKRGRQDE